MFVVRKYIAYLVFDESEGTDSPTIAIEPLNNLVTPAIFEEQRYGKNPLDAYRMARKIAKDLNNKE